MKHISIEERRRLALRWGIVAVGLALSAWGTFATAQTTTMATSTSGSSPTCSLSISPTSLSAGQSATLNWVSSGANTGSIDQGLGSVASAASGSMTVQPATSTTYTGTFGGIGGTVSCSASISVSNGSMMSSSTSSTSTTPSMTATNYYYPGQTQGTSSMTSGMTTDTTQTAQSTQTSPMMPSLPISTLTAYPASGSTPAPMVVQITSSGNALVRGTVLAVQPSMITIRSWGGIWIVRTNSSSTVIPSSGSVGDLSGISVGDFVGVDGTLGTDQIYTIDAGLVRDWTTNPYVAPSSAASTSSGSSGSSTGTGSPSGAGASSTGPDLTPSTGTSSDTGF